MTKDRKIGSSSDQERFELAEGAVRTGVPYNDPAKAISFLTDVFGMRVLRSWGSEDDPVFCYLSFRNSVMSIFMRPRSDDAWSTVGPVSVGLTQPDEEALTRSYQRAVSGGHEILRELQISSNPAVRDYLGFVLRDFEGNLWSMESRGWSFEA